MKKTFIVVVLAVTMLQTFVAATQQTKWENILQLVSNNQVHHREARSSEVPIITAEEMEKKVADEATARVSTYTGTLPNSVYPNSDFVSYGTNCNFDGNDFYIITGVSDVIKCGSQFCYGDRRCTHFAYRSDVSGGYCVLKSRYGIGSSWATYDGVGAFCGMIPNRACNVNSGSISNLLGCLSLNF